MQKVLIIKMSALGDVFMALPHVEAILSHHHQDQVWLMTSPPCGELFVNHPALKLILLDRKKLFSPKNAYARILWVRRRRFDSIYDLQGNRTSRLLTRFANASRRVGTQPLNVYNFHPENFYDLHTQQNVFDRLNETIVASGLPPASPGFTLYPSENDVALVSRWKNAKDLRDRRFVLMHANSSNDWPSKRWPQQYFIALARQLEGQGLRCVWIGGEEDRQVNRILAQAVGVDATGEFSILQLYQLGKFAKIAVTNDSGPMHILAASGLPVYSFFGPTNWVRSHALGQSNRVLWTDIDCSPCFLGRCPPNKEHACLKNIKPENVYRKIKMDGGL